MKFSIVTPTWNRWDGRLQRCLRSVVWQEFRLGEFEHIVVDDGSTDHTYDAFPNADFIGKYERIEHSGRVIARNKGMELAKGDWICWLDSDDALDPMYLATFARAINVNPNAKLLVCGAVVHGMRNSVPIWTKLRHAKKPPIYEPGGRLIEEHEPQSWVHDNFPSGTIGTGMFMFHRSLLEQTGFMPGWKTHLEVADGVDEWLGYETGYSAEERWVGNPWGDDWAFFRKLTMFAEVRLVGQEKDVSPCLYVQYVREN